MSEPNLTALELYGYLNKSNCGDCGLPTCMAFAVQVIQQTRKLSDCPHLPANRIEEMAFREARRQHLNEVPDLLKERVRAIDFSGAARRLAARPVEDMLAFSCLGRDFLVDQEGELHAECHVNFWVHVPLLNYIHHCKGRALTGEWVKYDQLRNAMSFSNYFAARCETALKELADLHGKLFFDSLSVLGGRKGPEDFGAERTVRLQPLPRVPFLVCHWPKDEEFDSKLSVFFDRSAEDNIDPESLYILGMGLVEMLKKFIRRHGTEAGIVKD